MRDVVRGLGPQHVAYTTVMTTMDRLFQKGLLKRETGNKAYVYFSAMTFPELQTQVARDLIVAFLMCRQASSGLLAAALVDAVGAFDTSLLNQLEDEIRARRVHELSESESRGHGWSPAAADSWPMGNS